MTVRAGSGWQTLLADLSLILFMVMATAVNDPSPVSRQTQPAEPVAQWRDAREAPGLAAWLDQQARDARLRLTIVAPPDAAERALQLARTSRRSTRVVLDPLAKGPPIAVLTYDTPTEELPR